MAINIRESIAVSMVLTALTAVSASSADTAPNTYIPYIYGSGQEPPETNWTPAPPPTICHLCISLPRFRYSSFEIAARGSSPSGTLVLTSTLRTTAYEVECILIAESTVEIDDGLVDGIVFTPRAYVRARSDDGDVISVELSNSLVQVNPVLRVSYPSANSWQCGFDADRVFQAQQYEGSVEYGYVDPF